MRRTDRRHPLLHATAIVLAAVMRSAAPVSAAPLGDPAAEAPVRIDGCSIVERTYLSDPFNSMRTNLVSGVAVRFVNVRRSPATRIRIALRYQGSTAWIVERGAFTAGDPFARTATAFTGDAYAGAAAACVVTSVDYADGTTWNAAF